MGSAFLMVAHQVAAKAARDGLFLSRFPVTDLPRIALFAALLSILLGLGFSRLLSRFGPTRLVPFAVLGSAALHALEYSFLSTHRDLIVTFAYLHIVGFGAILLSGFWSLASEAFDPREAKLRFGRIAGAGTAGGILGGLLAERTVAWSSPDSLLLLLAGAHVLAFLLLISIGGFSPSSRQADEPGLSAARDAFRQAPFLLSLAALVLLGTTSAALLDYLFKSGAASSFARGPELTRYFALFYTGSQLLTFLVQTFLTPIALERLGLGRTVMTLGLAIMGGAGSALAIPAFGMTASVRALELILRGSFFRSGYELFFTPIPARQKRAVKTVIDVGCDRFGDALGAGVLQLLLLLGPLYARVEILLLAIAFSAISVWITLRMDKAYVAVLENGLRHRAIELDLSDVQDSTTMLAVLNTAQLERLPNSTAPVAALPSLPTTDPALADLASLRSGDLTAVRRTLNLLTTPDPILIPQLIRLLAWDEVSSQVRELLIRTGPPVAGQLADALLDERYDFAVRRRLPRILARCPSQRSFDALLAAQADPRFEIRFQASRALDYLKQQQPALSIAPRDVFSLVARELSVSRPIWEGRKLLDSRDPADSGFSFLDDLLRERSNQSLEHVFSLLSLILPREPLKLAFRALHSTDRHLLGLGLEYLASTLPDSLFQQLTQLIEATPATPQRPAEEVVHDLLESGHSLMLELKRHTQPPA